MPRKTTRPVKLLAGDNPQIAKADGDAPVRAYIAAMPGWKRDAGARLDAIIERRASLGAKPCARRRYVRLRAEPTAVEVRGLGCDRLAVARFKTRRLAQDRLDRPEKMLRRIGAEHERSTDARYVDGKRDAGNAELVPTANAATSSATVTHMPSSTPTPRRLISSGSTFERDIGYSRAVVVGDRVLVAGTTGFDYARMTISDDVAVQAAQCLRNIEIALVEAGSSLRDVVRVRYILPDAADFPATWPVLRGAFGEIRPAATMFEAKLADPRMKIEIEVEAVIGSA